MYTPMPSPRGTNNERLFISTGRGAAYDSAGGLDGLSPAQYGRRAARRLAYDDTNPSAGQAQAADPNADTDPDKIADWCKQNLSYEAIQKLVLALQDDAGAQDEPPDFRGRPHTGGTMSAMDARPRVREMSAAERLSLNSVCPGLSRIKII
jgi:hypothetical protein